jgi:hypothetical protein
MARGTQTADYKPIQASGELLQQWQEFTQGLKQVTDHLAAAKLTFNLYFRDVKKARQLGVTIPRSSLIDAMYKAVEQLDRQVLALNTAYAYTQSMRAGIAHSSQQAGDINLVANPGLLSQAEIQAATVDLKPDAGELGLHPLIIAGLAVVTLVTGAIITTKVLDYRAKTLQTEVEKGRQEIEKQLLTKPAVLPQWTQYKQSQQTKQTEAWIDQLLGPGSGKALMGGVLGIGFLLVGGFLIMRYLEKK